MRKKRIFFVCTDNLGRSIIAERCLRDYLFKNHFDDFEVYSAGTNASSDTSGYSFSHLGELKKIGIDSSVPKRIQLTRTLIDSADLLIVFDESQQEWIKGKFNIDVSFFNEIYKNEKSSISCKNYTENITLDEKMIRITDYIYNAIPVLFDKILILTNNS